jgi:CMP/dCMP kinase
MAEMVITIDGPAGSGKSTAARRLAEKIGASFLDTGAMYRSVTLAAMQAGVDMSDEKELLGVLKNNKFKFAVSRGAMVVSINGIDVTEQIRRPNVTANAKYIASAAAVRDELVKMQRQFAADEKKIVTEGRDQGTVAFPDADFKFFLTASIEERAKRRQVELETKGENVKFEEIKNAIEQRDKSDQSRQMGPLKPAFDAVVVDTTDLSIEDVVERLLSDARRYG